MNYKKDLESLHDPASDLPNLLYLNHTLNISKIHSDVSCLYKNDLKNICSKECSMYSHCRIHKFLVLALWSRVVDCRVVTIVVGGCSEEKGAFREIFQLLEQLIY